MLRLLLFSVRDGVIAVESEFIIYKWGFLKGEPSRIENYLETKGNVFTVHCTAVKLKDNCLKLFIDQYYLESTDNTYNIKFQTMTIKLP